MSSRIWSEYRWLSASASRDDGIGLCMAQYTLSGDESDISEHFSEPMTEDELAADQATAPVEGGGRAGAEGGDGPSRDGVRHGQRARGQGELA